MRRGLGQRGGRADENGGAGRQREAPFACPPAARQCPARRIRSWYAAHRADRVHDEHHVGIFFLERGDFGERAHDAGGSFVVDDGEGVELAGGELFVHGLGADGRAPVHLERLGLFAAAFGDVEPFVRKRAAHAVEDLSGDEIADGAFHHAPGGRGGEIDQLLGGKQLLELRLDFGVKVFEALAAMTDHRRAKRLEGLLADLDRSRNV